MSQAVVVVGSGQMGAGIAQVCAQSNYTVALWDANRDALERAKSNIKNSLTKLSEKKLITESVEAIMARLRFCSVLDEVLNPAPSVVIEAITENFEVKRELFQRMDSLLPKDCIFASNTSSISITKLAAVTQRPDKVIGMHFMNPVPIMKLVEVIKGLRTSEATQKFINEMALKLGKTTVQSNDKPGFIVNRILMPMINEACFALEENLASAEDIDTAMKLGTNQPMGPLALADFIGLDTCLFIMQVLFEGLGDSKYRPAPLLRQYVEAGYLGRKSKRGFFQY